MLKMVINLLKKLPMKHHSLLNIRRAVVYSYKYSQYIIYIKAYYNNGFSNKYLSVPSDIAELCFRYYFIGF
jgi:hypothetical protein